MSRPYLAGGVPADDGAHMSQSLSFSIVEAARAASLGRPTIYEALVAGRLRARKVGRRTIILEEDLREFLRSLPPARSR